MQEAGPHVQSCESDLHVKCYCLVTRLRGPCDLLQTCIKRQPATHCRGLAAALAQQHIVTLSHPPPGPQADEADGHHKRSLELENKLLEAQKNIEDLKQQVGNTHAHAWPTNTEVVQRVLVNHEGAAKATHPWWYWPEPPPSHCRARGDTGCTNYGTRQALPVCVYPCRPNPPNASPVPAAPLLPLSRSSSRRTSPSGRAMLTRPGCSMSWTRRGTPLGRCKRRPPGLERRCGCVLHAVPMALCASHVPLPLAHLPRGARSFSRVWRDALGAEGTTHLPTCAASQAPGAQRTYPPAWPSSVQQRRGFRADWTKMHPTSRTHASCRGTPARCVAYTRPCA